MSRAVRGAAFAVRATLAVILAAVLLLTLGMMRVYDWAVR